MSNIKPENVADLFNTAEALPGLLMSVGRSEIAESMADEVTMLAQLAVAAGLERAGLEKDFVGSPTEILGALFNVVFTTARLEGWSAEALQCVVLGSMKFAAAIVGSNAATGIMKNASKRARVRRASADAIQQSALDEVLHALRHVMADAAKDMTANVLSRISASSRASL